MANTLTTISSCFFLQQWQEFVFFFFSGIAVLAGGK